ncbi:SigE family RNA polymerase sigma factor [Kitasatospora sp. NPDC059673]|uniref:SigE family RNA polymerase sigma factor n=1 Tax=Kitasatospora sp. NPDC059673 TaxID=3346901 RepID=UPI00369FAEA3
MTATLTTRNAGPRAAVLGTNRPRREEENTGTLFVRGCAHSTGTRRPVVGTRNGDTTHARTGGNTFAGPAAGRMLRLAPQTFQADQGDAQGEHPAAAKDEARNIAEFTAYVRERRASLYATAYHLTGDRYEAEDLLQSALFSTYRAWGRITDKAAVGGYLRRTMTNLHISAWRRRKVNEYPTEELPEHAGDTDAMGGTELRTVLWQALAKLPENQRTMLVLRYYEGRTDPEIADILGISVGTVKSSIWRALRRMREDEQLNRSGDTVHAFGELVA